VENINLTGHFLIAMPAMADPHFSRALAYICEHNENGALGIVINRPIEMRLNELLDQINVEGEYRARNDADHVYFGGPVQTDRGFVLHQPVGAWQSTIAVSRDTALTTSKDILEATARGQGPQKMLVSLGYAGWTAGQLEQELAQNAWLTVEPNEADKDAIIFDLPTEQKLTAAMALLGVDFANLSEEAGHA
jgi:putative transcriptional regulator